MNQALHSSMTAVAPAQTSVGDLIDTSRLKDLAEYDDEELSMTREVLDLFVKQADPAIAELKACQDTADAARLRKITHTLRGAASNIGAIALAAACERLEEACSLTHPSEQLKAYVWPQDAHAQIDHIEKLSQKTLTTFAQLDLRSIL